MNELEEEIFHLRQDVIEAKRQTKFSQEAYNWLNSFLRRIDKITSLMKGERHEDD